MLGPTNGHRHLLADVHISDHAMKRYRERRRWLGFTGVPGFTDEQEVRMLMSMSQPCYGMPTSIREFRTQRHGEEASYWHSGPWRLVVIPSNSELATIEPDIHEGNLGVWRGVEQAVRFIEIHGFTIQECTGGVIKNAYR